MSIDSPEKMYGLFEKMFNDQDLDGMLEIYHDDAILIAQPGVICHGKTEIAPALKQFLDLGGKAKLETKKVFVAGDLAYLSNRWSITGIQPDGNLLNLTSVTTEVMHRQPDGTWLVTFDNVWGDAGMET